MTALFDTGFFGAFQLENELIFSKEIELVKIPIFENTPIYEMNLVYAPTDYAVHRLFGHDKDYDHYILEIDLHHAVTPSMRHQDTHRLKSNIEALGNNTMIIVQSPDNNRENKNPAMLLIGSDNIDELMQKMLTNGQVLGKKATIALGMLNDKILPAFKVGAERRIYA